MYSVTDKCSFDECNRLKFLINYNKRRKKIGSNYKVNMQTFVFMFGSSQVAGTIFITLFFCTAGWDT